MPTILHRLPFYADNTTLRIPNGPAIEIVHDQIVIWVSIVRTAQAVPSQLEHRFPAVLDLGFNGSFLLREDHLDHWAHVRPDEENFPLTRFIRVHGENVPVFDADIWLHPSVPRFRDQLADVPPVRLEMTGGFVVVPPDMHQIRLPLLGLSALRKNRLRLVVNGAKKHISLRSAWEGETP